MQIIQYRDKLLLNNFRRNNRRISPTDTETCRIVPIPKFEFRPGTKWRGRTAIGTPPGKQQLFN